MRERGEEEPGRRASKWIQLGRRAVVVVAVVYAREADARERFGDARSTQEGAISWGLVRISPRIGTCLLPPA
jgi:hypothetical protein